MMLLFLLVVVVFFVVSALTVEDDRLLECNEEADVARRAEDEDKDADNIINDIYQIKTSDASECSLSLSLRRSFSFSVCVFCALLYCEVEKFHFCSISFPREDEEK